MHKGGRFARPEPLRFPGATGFPACRFRACDRENRLGRGLTEDGPATTGPGGKKSYRSPTYQHSGEVLMSSVTLGVIGGSGFYQIDGLEMVEQVELTTPFGAPSDAYCRGRLGDTEIVFLARHGRGHRILPSELNYCANIFGMQ